MIAAVALDLGSTRIKAARLNDDGRLEGLVALAVPPLEGTDPIRQGNAEDYLTASRQALRQTISHCPSDVPVSIAAQRSTFVLWERTSGQILTPLISWQDRRAQKWCNDHQKAYKTLSPATGLPLSPHYAGPKLAQLLAENPDLRADAARGNVLFGTLETLLVWHLTGGGYHQTDISMAARTLMADIRTGQWDSRLLAYFDIPMSILPRIVPTSGLRIPLAGGGTLAATVSDQAAGLFAAIHSKDDAVAINLGTGGFIMAPLGHEPMNVKGYLTAPIQRTIAGKATYCLEGTINAIGPALDAHPGPSPMPDEIDPNPDLFCLADNAGVGAPYWQADPTLTFSRSIIHLCDGDVRRSIMEGIIFRVCQIVQDFLIIQPLTRLIVSGGMAKELFIVQGLSAVTGLKTAVSLEPEATLWGASSLAADKPVPPPAMEIVPPSFKQWSYLKSKFQRWKQWMGRILPDIRQY